VLILFFLLYHKESSSINANPKTIGNWERVLVASLKSKGNSAFSLIKDTTWTLVSVPRLQWTVGVLSSDVSSWQSCIRPGSK
jgi:hypothetical protein